MSDEPSRRRLLALVGAGATAGLAGCSDLGLSPGGTDSGDGSGGDGDSGGGDGSDGAGDGGVADTATPTATAESGGESGGATPTETASSAEDQTPTATPRAGTSTEVPTIAGGPGAVEDAYPQFQYDAANTGTGATTGPSGPPSVDWRWPAEPDEEQPVRHKAVVGSTVYASRIVTSGSQTQARVVALDAATGEQYWQRDVGERTGRHGNLAVAGGSVYLVVGRQLVSLSAATGEAEWTVEHGGSRGTAVVAGDTVYTSDLEKVTAHATSDGSQRWRHTPEVSDDLTFTMTPAVRNGYVFVGATDVQALSPEDGSVQWTGSVESTVSAAPTAGPERVYVPTEDGETLGFAHSDGSLTWQSSAMSEAFSYDISPALVGETLYLASSDKLAAVSRSDASGRWSVTSDFGDDFSTLSVVDGVVYSQFVSTVQARDAGNGDQLWTYQGSANMSSGRPHPTVVDGFVYFRDGNRQFLALSA